MPDLGLSLAYVSYWLAYVRFDLTQGLSLVSKVNLVRGRFKHRLCIMNLKTKYALINTDNHNKKVNYLTHIQHKYIS